MAACKVCDHPARAAIDAALASGTAQREVARRFQVGKSTLGRHLPHVTRPDAPPPPAPDADASCPTRPTVAQVQARIFALEAERAALEAEHAAVLAQRRELAEELPRLRFLERRGAVMRTEDQLSALEAAAHALELQLATYGGTLAVAVRALEDARRRHGAARKAHWARIRPTLEDPMLRWCCTLNGEPSVNPGMPPLPPGRYLVEYDYQALCQQLQAHYPMTTTLPCQCAVCSAPEPEPEPWEGDVVIYDWHGGRLMPRAEVEHGGNPVHYRTDPGRAARSGV